VLEKLAEVEQASDLTNEENRAYSEENKRYQMSNIGYTMKARVKKKE
jgi:hypothetical protein